jgi:hypothetical protein
MKASEIISWIGAALIVLAFFLVNYNFLTVGDISYQLMNLFGALALFYRALEKKVPSIATLQIIWALIAIGALIKIIV